MKIQLIAALFMFLIRTASAFNENPPERVVTRIQELIREAKLMDKDVAAAKAAWQDAKDARDPDENQQYLNYRRELDRQNGIRSKAIRMTLTAYEIWPEARNGTSVSGWTKGRDIAWAPIAGDREHRSIRNKNGKYKELEQPDDKHGAITYTDGVTYIMPEVFSRGPRALASVLLHERTHFERSIGRAANSGLEYEEEAYNAQFKRDAKGKLTDKAYFLEPDADRVFLGIVTDLRYTAENNANVIREGRKGLEGIFHKLFPPEDPDIFQMQVHTDKELEEIKKRGDELDAEVDAEIRSIRREREQMKKEREEALQREIEQRRREIAHLKPPGMPDAPLARIPGSQHVPLARVPDNATEAKEVAGARDYLWRAAKEACANPGRLTYEDVAAMDSAYRTIERRGPDFGIPSPSAITTDLAGCQKELLLHWFRIKTTFQEWMQREPGLFNSAASEEYNKYPPSSPPQYYDDGGNDRNGSPHGGRGPGSPGLKEPTRWN
jgi:hypothetical protein